LINSKCEKFILYTHSRILKVITPRKLKCIPD